MAVSKAQVNQTPDTKKEKKEDYIEVKLPKVRFADTPLSPLWVILLIIFAFLLGMTTTKIQYLQNGETTIAQAKPQEAGQQPTAITTDEIKKWATSLRLNTQKFAACLEKQTYQARIDSDMKDATSVRAQATPTFYVNGRQLVGAQPFSEFKKAIDEELQKNSGFNSLIKKAYAQEEQPVSISPTPDRYEVGKGGLPVLGNPNAPVKIIEFSDFECPYCRRFFKETYPQIKKEYIDTGKVALYYRHLPLPMHPNAKPFAHAAECANEQGKFWQMHDKIFTGQENV